MLISCRRTFQLATEIRKHCEATATDGRATAATQHQVKQQQHRCRRYFISCSLVWLLISRNFDRARKSLSFAF